MLVTKMTHEILKQIVNELDFHTLPLQYIAAISYTDENGFEELYTGEQISKVINSEIKLNTAGEAMFLLDSHAIYRTVTIEFMYIYEGINKLVDEYEKQKNIAKKRR